MRAIWRTPQNVGDPPNDLLYRVRTSDAYRGAFYALTQWILPGVFALLIFLVLAYCAVVLGSRVYFAVADAAGAVCRGRGGPEVTAAGSTVSGFETKEMCRATGYTVEKGGIYRVTLKITDGWEDGHEFKSGAAGITTGPNGFGWERSTWPMALGVPFRRLLWSNWFQTVLRVGSRGFEEHVLDLAPVVPPTGEPQTYSATFKARKNGEVFLFVNDAVLGTSDRFYRTNNKGKADVTIALARG
jgi:hypothetical protein